MKICFLNIVLTALLALPVAAESKPETLQTWKFGSGTLKLFTFPANKFGQIGLGWYLDDSLIKSSYCDIEDLAKLIRALAQHKDWNSIADKELKIHWRYDILVTLREKEVVFNFDSIHSFTTTWDEALNIVKAIESARKKLNEESGGITPLDAKIKDSEQGADGNPH